MKRFFATILSAMALSSPPFSFSEVGPAADQPLTAVEQALVFDPSLRKTDDSGRGFLLVKGEPITLSRVLGLSPWDLMDLVQTLSGKLIPLSRFGNGGADALTQAWRTRVATFTAAGDAKRVFRQEDLFDPALVLWDPGYIQNLNAWGKWTIHIARRDLEQEDLATLSPLEVQQAVEVLTGRTYPVEFVLDHLEAFRAQLSVVPRLSEALAVHP